MDVLSDVLLAVRLTGAVFFDVDARSPFATESPGADRIGEQVMGTADRVIGFHVVTEGTCWAEAVDGPGPRRAPPGRRDGDLPGRRRETSWPRRPGCVAHRTRHSTTGPSTACCRSRSPPGGRPARTGAGSSAASWGATPSPFNPLLEALPRIVRAPVSEASWRWVTHLLDAAVEATGHGGAGREAMLAKLAELMFVEALRGHLDQLPPDARNWVAGLRDPQVGAALRLLHGRPAEPWTLERLAREVAMSRSSFAERFTAYVGVPPMQYLGRWRLQLAARMLTSDAVSVGQAAAAVGYQSEAAFNRAFKREVGEAPGAWRRGRRTRRIARVVGARATG